MKILTLTPNPALDLSGHVAALVPNEKNYVRAPRKDPGGNGINAARVARRLGARVLALGFVGGPTGDQFTDLVDREGLPHRFTRIKGHTRINVTVTNDSDHQQTRLTFPGPEVSRPEVSALMALVRRERGPGLMVLGGSLPEGCGPDFHQKMVKLSAGQGLGCVVDVPAKFLRRFVDGRGPRLLMIKPNQTELEELTGKKFRDQKGIVAAAQSLTRISALVCVSLGGEGAILACESHAWLGKSPKVKAKGTVGAGDSMVGAMAARLVLRKLARPEDVDSAICSLSGTEAVKDVFSWGLAAGAATASMEGTAMATASQIRLLQRKVRISII